MGSHKYTPEEYKERRRESSRRYRLRNRGEIRKLDKIRARKWRKQNPDKTFIPASEKAECQYMKMITLQKVHDSLMEDKYEVKVPKETADKARLAIERMLAIS